MKKIGVCGCGNMGGALVTGMVARGKFLPANICIFDVKSQKARRLAKSTRVKVARDPEEIAKETDFILLAVKPQDFKELAGELKEHLRRRHLVMSIMAGLTVKALKHELGAQVRVSRIMPNMPALIGEGVSAIYYTGGIRAGEKQVIRKVFRSIGQTLDVREDELNAVTALSGSGPAYVFHFATALLEAGRRAGLSRDKAKRLVYGTLSGSAKLLESVKEDPEELTRRVASKGGTTEAALRVLNKENVWASLTRAVLAAERRARELSGD